MSRLESRGDPEPPVDDLFPTKGAIPEARQIGRGDAIAELTEWFLDGSDVLTIQPRRIGKSSAIGNGALPRIREDYGGVVAQVDLRRAGLSNTTALADALICSALESGAGNALRADARSRVLRRTRRYLKGPRAQAAAELTKEGGALATLQALATLLAGNEDPGPEALHRVLMAFELEAVEHEKPVVVFIDEIQDLGDENWWDPREGFAVQKELARAMSVQERLVTYAFAGSEPTAMEKVFAPGMPLHFEGERYVLPPIGHDAWHADLPLRFARDGRTIPAVSVDRILTASQGHPLRTMQVCKAALRLVRHQQLQEVTLAVVDEAADRARRHPSWE